MRRCVSVIKHVCVCVCEYISWFVRCCVLCCHKTHVFMDTPVGRCAVVFYGVIRPVCVSGYMGG